MASGSSLGNALNNLLREFRARPGYRLKSYQAKGWHAKLVQLTGTKRGYEQLERAGLDVKPDTLMKWLADPEYPVRRSYIDQISTAYEEATRVAASPIPQEFKDHQFEIYGQVKIGTDVRTRGAEGTAPLRIDGSNGDWTRIDQRWEEGLLDDDTFEEFFADDVIVEDIGEGTEPWEFPGGSYTVN